MMKFKIRIYKVVLLFALIFLSNISIAQNYPNIKFDVKNCNFGDKNESEIVICKFKFTSIGEKNLRIDSIKLDSDRWKVVSYTNYELSKGQKGEIIFEGKLNLDHENMASANVKENITVFTNSPFPENNITITGNIIPIKYPYVVFLNQEYNFGDIANIDSASHSFRLKNTGDTTLIIKDIVLHNLSVVDSYKTIIEPSEEISITFKFSPEIKKTNDFYISGSATFITNTLKGSERVTLKGNYIENISNKPSSDILFDDNIINIGEVKYGSRAVATINFTSTGVQPLVIDSIINSSKWVVTSKPSDILSKGETGIITLEKIINSNNDINDDITIYTNTITNKYILKINGHISKNQSAIMSFSKQSHNLGYISSSDSAYYLFKIVNTGNVELNIYDIKTDSLLVISAPKEKLAPNEATFIKLGLDSTYKQDKPSYTNDGRVYIYSNAINSPSQLYLKGIIHNENNFINSNNTEVISEDDLVTPEELSLIYLVIMGGQKPPKVIIPNLISSNRVLEKKSNEIPKAPSREGAAKIRRRLLYDQIGVITYPKQGQSDENLLKQENETMRFVEQNQNILAISIVPYSTQQIEFRNEYVNEISKKGYTVAILF